MHRVGTSAEYASGRLGPLTDVHRTLRRALSVTSPRQCISSTTITCQPARRHRTVNPFAAAATRLSSAVFCVETDGEKFLFFLTLTFY